MTDAGGNEDLNKTELFTALRNYKMEDNEFTKQCLEIAERKAEERR